MAIDITEIIEEYGLRYINAGQAAKDLMKTLEVRKDTVTDLFTTRTTPNTQLHLGTFGRTPVLQAYQDTFTPKGGVVFNPSPIQLFKNKIDVSVTPDEIEESWLGFLADNNVDRAQWPIIRWMLVQIMMQRAEDEELNTIFNGERVEPTDGTPGAAAEAYNGIKKVVNTHIDNSLITPFALGAVPTDEELFVDYIEEFVMEMPEGERVLPRTIAMSLELEDLFFRGMQKKYNVYYGQQPDLLTTFRYKNIKVKGYTSWGTSKKIVTTAKENALYAVKRVGLPKIESNRRKVDIFRDDWVGIGYHNPARVFTNDQDLTPVVP